MPNPLPNSHAPYWPCPHNCLNWVRQIHTNTPVTNHHPNCEFVDESLIDVWRVQTPGDSGGLYLDSEEAAKQAAHDEAGGEPLTITKEKMHREIYENLPEFNGF